MDEIHYATHVLDFTNQISLKDRIDLQKIKNKKKLAQHIRFSFAQITGKFGLVP